MTRNVTGLLIVRAWVEHGSSQPLRAHLRLTTNVAFGFEREVTLSDMDSVCVAVEAWLRDVMAADPLPEGQAAGATQ